MKQLLLLLLAISILTISACSTKGPFNSNSQVSAGRFLPGPTMRMPRAYPNMLMLDDSNVLVTGGTYFRNLLGRQYPEPVPPELYLQKSNKFIQAAGPTCTEAELKNGTLSINGYRLATEIISPKATGSIAQGINRTHLKEGLSILLPAGKILIVGGFLPNDSIMCNSIHAEIYDIATKSSKLIGDMNARRRGATAEILNDGRVLIAGGVQDNMNNWQTYLDSTEIFDPKTCKFSIGPKLPTPRTSARSVKLKDGRVLIAGGFVYGDHASWNIAEIYDPKANTFSSTKPMATFREMLSLTLLRSGEVLVSGGAADGSKDCEIFNPETNSFRHAGNLIQYRTSHNSILLTDGSVLIAGGNDRPWPRTSKDPRPNALASSEIFVMK